MRLRSIAAAVLGTLFMADSASALSCMQPDIQRELKEAIESDKVYHIFVGYFDAPEKPKTPLNQPKPNNSLVFTPSARPETVDGFFRGYSLGKTPRQDTKLENLRVQIKTSCAAHWCGKVPPPDREMIAFLEAQENGPPLLTMGPCPHMSHNYSLDKVQTLRQGL